MVSTLNPEEIDVGSVVRKLVIDYDMKPLLTRPQHFFFTDNKTYFEVDIDVNQFGYVPRKAFGTLREKMHQMVIDLGFTVEAREEEELPECMLTVLHIHKKPLTDAWTFDQLLEASRASVDKEAEESASAS